MGSITSDAEARRFSGDQVVPLYAFDDTALNRCMPIWGVLRFGDVLDAAKLRDSLTTLTHINDWKKLRGRLRLDAATDRLSIHIPERASCRRPAIRFRNTVLGLPISAHPSMELVAQPSGSDHTQATVQEAVSDFRDVAKTLCPPDWPRTLEDYTDPEVDEPLLGLHVLSFTDSTVVVLTYLHVLMDGGGIKSLCSAWSQVLNGRTAEVPQLGGAWHDPLDKIRSSTSDVPPFALSDRKIDMGDFMPQDGSAPPIDALWDTSTPGSAWKTVCLPRDVVAAIIKETRETLRSKNDDDEKKKKNKKIDFVSEDDAVVGWLVRSLASLLPSERALNIMRVYDMRARLSFLESQSAYIQNMYQMVWTLETSAGRVVEAPAGMVAAHIRGSLADQASEEQVMAAVREREALGTTPLYGEPTGMFMTMNSWVKMDLYNVVDFSGAVRATHNGLKSEEEPVKAAPSGRPEGLDFNFNLPGPPPGPNCIQTGVDWQGTRRINIFLSGLLWQGFEAKLQKVGASV